MIQERGRAGLRRARSEGKRLGRPRIASDLEERIRKALATPGRPGVRVIAVKQQRQHRAADRWPFRRIRPVSAALRKT
ncbi:MAG TPA: hypothetical protein VHJ00_15760 [Bradyrhizobium sp.]|nr:hypothetical protein [Bradyrhizobium sp.]